MKKFLSDLVLKINQFSYKFLYSKKIIACAIFTVLLFAILEVYLFFFCGTEISGWSFTELQATNWTWLIYYWFLIAIFSSILGIIGDIYLHRNNKKCFIFYFGFLIIYFFNGLLLFLWFETIEIIILFFLVLLSYLNWGKKSIADQNKLIKSQKSGIVLLEIGLLLILGFLLGYLINLFLNDDFFSDPAPYLDALIMVSFVEGWVLLSNKYLQAYLFFMITTVLSLTLFIILGAWIYLGVNFFYLFLYFIGGSNWIEIYLTYNNK